MAKGGKNDAPLLSSPTVSHEDWENFLPISLFLSWKDNLSGKTKEQPVKMQLCKWELGGQSTC